MTQVAQLVAIEMSKKTALKGTVDHLSGGAKKATKKLNTFLSEADSFEELVSNKIPDLMEATDLVIQGISCTDTSLLYWRDELGEHSYYTDDLTIQGS